MTAPYILNTNKRRYTVFVLAVFLTHRDNMKDLEKTLAGKNANLEKLICNKEEAIFLLETELAAKELRIEELQQQITKFTKQQEEEQATKTVSHASPIARWIGWLRMVCCKL